METELSRCDLDDELNDIPFTRLCGAGNLPPPSSLRIHRFNELPAKLFDRQGDLIDEQPCFSQRTFGNSLSTRTARSRSGISNKSCRVPSSVRLPNLQKAGSTPREQLGSSANSGLASLGFASYTGSVKTPKGITTSVQAPQTTEKAAAASTKPAIPAFLLSIVHAKTPPAATSVKSAPTPASAVAEKPNSKEPATKHASATAKTGKDAPEASADAKAADKPQSPKAKTYKQSNSNEHLREEFVFEDEITHRMLSLPNIICRAATGDLFIVDLKDVQKMLQKRQLGSEGVKTLKHLEGSHVATWDHFSWKDIDPYHDMVRNKESSGTATPRKLAKAKIKTKTKTKASVPVPDVNVEVKSSTIMNVMRLEDLDEEVRRHLLDTLSQIDRHRAHLIDNSPKTKAEVERQERAKKYRDMQQAAVEFAVKTLVPQKLLAMANMRRLPAAPLHRAAFKPGSANEPSRMGSEDGEEQATSPRRGSNPAHFNAWAKASRKVQDVWDRMPFLTEWTRATRKLQKEEGPHGWDALMGTAQDVYVKGQNRVPQQGTAVYVLKCHELGVTPSTQVIQQLHSSEANMSHCKLGRTGAQALRHALAANTAITTLNLEDNGFDAQGVEEIVLGLTSGHMAKTPRERHATERKWKNLHHPNSMASGPNQIGSPSTSDCGAVKSERHSETTNPTDNQPSISEPNLSGDELRCLSPLSPHKVLQGLPGTLVQPPKVQDCIFSRVQSLDLSGNPLGVNGAKLLAGLLDPLQTGYQFLTELRLNKCGIPEVGGLAICKSLLNNNQVLQLLHMANNALCNKTAAAFGEVLPYNRTLTDLDLSWNMIKPEGMAQLCVGLEDNLTLHKLNLSWNGLEDEGVKKIGELLSKNEGLLHLDLTNVRMSSGAALIVGEGLKANSTLEVLVLNGNAVGDDGARHLMNALKFNTSLRYLGLQGTNMSSAARGCSNAANFNPLAPDGSYQLDLAQSTDRAVALQLCQLEVASASELMQNIRLDNRHVSSCKAMNWPQALPVSGVLQCDFISKRAQKVVKVMEPKKFQALLGQLSSSSMGDKERLNLIEVMAPFSYLLCQQIATILKTFSMGDELVQAAALLFTRAADLEEHISVLTSAMQERDLHELHEQLGWYSYVRFSNCTGHYELNFSKATHQHLAMRLKDAAYAETAECNNWINIIHDKYSQQLKVPANYGPPEAWKGTIPHNGTLSFDYVTGSRAPEGAVPIEQDRLLDFLQHGIGIQFNAQRATVPEQEFSKADLQVALLRQEVGHQFYLTCEQVLTVLQCFKAGPHRVEVVVMLFALITDPDQLWTVLYALQPIEHALAVWRLGPENTFDRNHPSGHYVLDLAQPSHEQAAKRLVELAGHNTELPNFWNIRMQGTKRAIMENRNMWGTFTAETFTPFLEFDFIGNDALEVLLKKSKADIEAMGKGDKLDAITKLAHRFELQRIKCMYPYYQDGSGWQAPEWQSTANLFKALLGKTPWNAAWDRLMRLLVRYEARSGDIQSDSYIEDIFDDYSNEDNEMGTEAFEHCCRDWGYTRGETWYCYRKLFDAAARPSQVPLEAPDGHSVTTSVSGASHTATAPLPDVPAHDERVASDAAFSSRPSNAASEAGLAPRHSIGFQDESVIARRTSGASDAELASHHSTRQSQTPTMDHHQQDVSLNDATTFTRHGLATRLSHHASSASSAAAAAAANTAAAPPPPPMVIDFMTFVNIFMQEPPPEAHFKEAPGAYHSTGGADGKALDKAKAHKGAKAAKGQAKIPRAR